MIREIQIKNYKSVAEMNISLGRINVLIGANGSGKSNILEAITFGAAAANDKLDNEFLTSRGIRVSDDPRFMRSAFDAQATTNEVTVSFVDEDGIFTYPLRKDNDSPYASWTTKDRSVRLHPHTNSASSNVDPADEEWVELQSELLSFQNKVAEYSDLIRDNPKLRDTAEHIDFRRQLKEKFREFEHQLFTGIRDLRNFLVYSPENSALRTFQEEGQIQPLGIRGEGLFKLLKFISTSDSAGMAVIKDKLALIDWFADFDIASELAPSERRLKIRDRYLDDKLAYFDQQSANEGFLFLLFYFCLFISKDTPTFFAIDNIDASLNPKLCSQIMTELVALAETQGKQAILTTHNPAVLDGLNLTDDEQRLFVVSRNQHGHTRIKRILAPKVVEGRTPVRLSEAFLRGYLGGLPENF